MQASSVPVIKDIVLVGGGHAHVTVLKRFGMKPVPGVRLTLISPDAHTPYSGMLPGFIAGHYTYDDAHIDLMPLCRFAGATFLRTSIDRINADEKIVNCTDGRPPIRYDLLSINSGSTPDPVVVPGADGRVIPVKPVSEFLELWSDLKSRVLKNPGRRIAVIGSGAGGIELILSAQFALTKLLSGAGTIEPPAFHVVTAGNEILATHNKAVRNVFLKTLKDRGITLHTNFKVDRVSEIGVHAGSASLELDDILWVTGANAPAWIANSGFDTDDRGFLRVRPSLQTLTSEDVFAAGDIASVEGHPRPKSGVFAVRQGPPLEANLRRCVLGERAKDFQPQTAFLSLISTGGKHAVASRSGWCLTGDWVWRWKDHIDRSFMDTFNKLPDMSQDGRVSAHHQIPAALDTPDVRAELGEVDMRCGGCGAKVGAASLSRVLSGFKAFPGTGVVAGLDHPDDAAILDPPAGQLLFQTIDAFRAMIDDPYLLGQIAANHALGDIYAMGVEPHSALAVITVPPGLPEKVEALLSQIMAGAGQVLAEARCTLIGGHTGEGAEITVGFAINAFGASEQAKRKSGMQPGDQLILTKALGTGTLFAAEMRAKAKGRWVQAAIESALLSNRDASGILKMHSVNACTDVTGFGLIGHLAEMVNASQVAVELQAHAIPALDGALETLSNGIVSSLQTQNMKIRDDLEASVAMRETPLFQLLFDPQTAGGLLTSVPEARALDCLRELRSAGYQSAAVIGSVVNDQSARISLNDQRTH